MLDETVVPTVQVQDLTVGPYLAGVQPAACTLPSPGVVGGQVVIFFNTDATMPPDANLAEDNRFIGRSLTITSLELVRRTQGAIRIRIGTVPRTTITASVFPTAKLFRDTQQGTGLTSVPVVLATVAAVAFVPLPAVQEWFHEEMTLGLGDANTVISVPVVPGLVLDRLTAIVIEETVAGALFDVNARGIFQTQAP